MSAPKVIFGAASIGMDFKNVSAVCEVLDLLEKNGVLQIDTAGRYPPVSPGLSETLLGEAKATEKGFILDTKILAGPGDGSGELEEPAIAKSLFNSLERLGVSTVHILHCHRPDPRTPLKDQLAALDKFHKQGRFKELGVSNFPPRLLQSVIEICEANNYIKPTVYQGDYSAITRGMEKELLPFLQRNGIVYNAFRPLSAGFLTGRLTAGMESDTRFGNAHPLGKVMKSLFDKEELHAALKTLNTAAGSAGLSMQEAALRWVFYHSALGQNDGVILGASKLTHIQSNLESISHGPLPEDLPRVFDDVWGELEEKRGNIL